MCSTSALLESRSGFVSARPHQCPALPTSRWEAVVEAFKTYFDLHMNCRSDSDLKLNGLKVKIGQLMGAMTQLMKQLMTNYVGKGDPELVKLIKEEQDTPLLLPQNEAQRGCS